MSIAENVKTVLEKAAAAAVRSGRKAEDVTVIGVAKTVGADSVLEMAKAGIRDVGENRVQELLSKRKALDESLPGLRFHMIGHLQSNKAKNAVASSGIIHSVDGVRLAESISRHAGEMGKVMDVLAEVNIAMEETKYGVPPVEVSDFARAVVGFSNIRLRGLMCVAPFVTDPEENRGHFRKMRELLAELNGRGHMMDILSMGMTIDYETAIEEGATMVRIGTAIFGERN